MDSSPNAVSSKSTAISEVAELVRHRNILRSLLGISDREFTIRELSMESGVPYATTWRIVADLLALGVIREKRVGASRVIGLNPTSPLLPELRKISKLRLQPQRDAAVRFAREVSTLPAVRRVILFGSVVRGTAGRGSDVDVAVVLGRRTERAMEQVYRVAGAIQDETGLKVVSVVLSPGELEGGTRLARNVRAGEVLYDRP